MSLRSDERTIREDPSVVLAQGSDTGALLRAETLDALELAGADQTLSRDESHGSRARRWRGNCRRAI